MVDSLEIQQFPLWEKLYQKRAPLAFNLEITARCNNDCRHCYINLPATDLEAKRDELTLEQILNIADQAVEMGAMWCLVTGGEPLLRPDFPEIYLGLKRKGLLVGVFTNATLVQKEHVKLLKRYPPRNLEVTVYGVTRATYEAVTRRPGSFAAFQRGLECLEENGLPVSLKAAALRSNLHEMHRIAEFCRRHAQDSFNFDPMLNLRHDFNQQRNAEIRAERLTPEEIVALEKTDPERLTAMHKECNEQARLGIGNADCDHLFQCGVGIGEFTVSYNGLFRLCTSLWVPGSTYDLKKGPLHSAWCDIVPRVHNLRSQNSTFLKTCRICPIINLCLFCPAVAYLETGRMDGETPYFCSVAHARAGMLGESVQGQPNGIKP